jgi:PTH2 family peptidyl-tRNA hydrolase
MDGHAHAHAHTRDRDIKQYLIVRTDLKMGTGKVAAQVGHAVLESFLKAEKMVDPDYLKQWKDCGQPKIVLKVDSLDHLMQIYETCISRKDVPCVIIFDEGLTQIDPSYTVVGLGPTTSSSVKDVVTSLRLYR